MSTIKVIIQSAQKAKEGVPLFRDTVINQKEIVLAEPDQFGIVEKGTHDGKIACYLLGEFDDHYIAFQMSEKTIDALHNSLMEARKLFL